jgi:hypothetical protein
MFRDGNTGLRRGSAQYVSKLVDAADLEEAKGREKVLIQDIRH